MWLDRFLSSGSVNQTAETAEAQPVRATRFHLDLPITFEAEGHRYEGQSLNVSDTGLLAKCDLLPELWTDGQLLLEAGAHYLNIHARVARVQANDVGFAFSVLSDNDRAAIRVLISSVVDRPVTPLDSSDLA